MNFYTMIQCFTITALTEVCLHELIYHDYCSNWIITFLKLVEQNVVLHSVYHVPRVGFKYLKRIPFLIEACAVLIPDLLSGLLSNW